MIESMLFSLLRVAVGSESAENSVAGNISEDMLLSVIALAKRHDLAHLIGYALDKSGWKTSEAISQTLNKQTMQAVYRYARQQNEFEQISQLLEDAKIPYIPLKGAIIRDWYPEPWMRTSSDIDILIHKENLEAGVSLLTEKLGYRHQGTAFHDASLYAPTGVHLELHYLLEDVTTAESVRKRLAEVWDHSFQTENAPYCYAMDDEWFYLFHIFHMVRHVINGGCGIKPFLDLWFMKRAKGYCVEKFEDVLASCGLLTAARAVERLADIWFSGGEMDELSSQLSSFVLNGGVHGFLGGKVMVAQARSGGRLRYLLQKVFLPYDIMKELYPFLIKHKWLLPVTQVLRWFNLLSKNRLRRTAFLFKHNVDVSKCERDKTEKLLRELDLLAGPFIIT